MRVALCANRALALTSITLSLLLLTPSPTHAVVAEKPIEGGLGIIFNSVLKPDELGSELEHVDVALDPDNRKIQALPSLPGQRQAWRHYLKPNLPRPLRKYPAATFVMLDEENRAMRVTGKIELAGCGAEVDWLVRTITKKYKVSRDMLISSQISENQAYRATFAGKQIDLRCGAELVVDYADYRAIAAWSKRQAARVRSYERQQAAVKKRQLVLDRRRAIRFADEFTLGDRFRLMGAFGIPFNQPFARNSTQNFPIDTPFAAVLPGLAPEFASGEITLEIAPDRSPIVIRGRFHEVSFKALAHALSAKYGTPLKASSRHIIHKIGANHAIVKRLAADSVELAFIDTVAQAAQRDRRWQQESEGV